MAQKDSKKDDKKQGKDKAQSSDKSAEAANLPLFYKKPAPLDAKAHAKLSLNKNFGFGFTEGVNAIPVNLIEMPQICHFYPIAFSPDGNATPVAILGLRDNENLFLKGPKDWEPDSYIPAYIRRYPFIFSELPESDQLTLCVDMNDDVISEKGDQPFFDGEGKPTELSNNALEFCKSYHAAAQQTVEFSKTLSDSGLLVEREAQINVADGKRINFSGFRIVDEKKLAELDDKAFLEWHKKGWLPFIYAHLFSGAQWQRLTKLLNDRLEKEAA